MRKYKMRKFIAGCLDVMGGSLILIFLGLMGLLTFGILPMLLYSEIIKPGVLKEKIRQELFTGNREESDCKPN